MEKSGGGLRVKIGVAPQLFRLSRYLLYPPYLIHYQAMSLLMRVFQGSREFQVLLLFKTRPIRSRFNAIECSHPQTTSLIREFNNCCNSKLLKEALLMDLSLRAQKAWRCPAAVPVITPTCETFCIRLTYSNSHHQQHLSSLTRIQSTASNNDLDKILLLQGNRNISLGLH